MESSAAKSEVDLNSSISDDDILARYLKHQPELPDIEENDDALLICNEQVVVENTTEILPPVEEDTPLPPHVMLKLKKMAKSTEPSSKPKRKKRKKRKKITMVQSGSESDDVQVPPHILHRLQKPSDSLAMSSLSLMMDSVKI